MIWSEEQKSRLEFLWQTSMVASEIGQEFGVSKNAVIGKVHRIGLPLRGKPRKPARLGPAIFITFPPKGHCYWADHDPTDPAFEFCGKKVADLDGVWCPEHRERVYIKSSASRRTNARISRNRSRSCDLCHSCVAPSRALVRFLLVA